MARARRRNIATGMDKIVTDLVTRCEDPLRDLDAYDRLEEIDLDRVPGWLEDVRVAERSLQRFRQQLEALVGERRCGWCDEPIYGRPDRAFCSTRCRVANHRANKKQREAAGA